MTITDEELAVAMARNAAQEKANELSRASDKAARAARKRSTCRTCGRAILECLAVEFVGTDVDGHRFSVARYRATGTFGAYGDGICTLRCGYRYACRTAPKAAGPASRSGG